MEKTPEQIKQELETAKQETLKLAEAELQQFLVSWREKYGVELKASAIMQIVFV